MSRNHNNASYFDLMDEIYGRYQKALSGYEFDFKTEIEPFLEEKKVLAMEILDFGTDARFHDSTREKMSAELMELLMACHSPKFRERHFYEKYKFINMWLKHAEKEGLM
ncbi:hypothetical protein [Salinicoccus halitifaciens]|uniref:Uncharacterized protein n=1 Tax=Salinicoccus halitifaciens TaxID=1073415 RepID=A0ABV2E6L3_9STAP|nr:hypothetical protein [Salinicoccus halitifaciens]MCD2136986.1 hypothetical protein [Salinicoccus halitifaciens]